MGFRVAHEAGWREQTSLANVSLGDKEAERNAGATPCSRPCGAGPTAALNPIEHLCRLEGSDFEIRRGLASGAKNGDDQPDRNAGDALHGSIPFRNPEYQVARPPAQPQIRCHQL
jgi:hypothetical protein